MKWHLCPLSLDPAKQSMFLLPCPGWWYELACLMIDNVNCHSGSATGSLKRDIFLLFLLKWWAEQSISTVLSTASGNDSQISVVSLQCQIPERSILVNIVPGRRNSHCRICDQLLQHVTPNDSFLDSRQFLTQGLHTLYWNVIKYSWLIIFLSLCFSSPFHFLPAEAHGDLV